MNRVEVKGSLYYCKQYTRVKKRNSYTIAYTNPDGQPNYALIECFIALKNKIIGVSHKLSIVLHMISNASGITHIPTCEHRIRGGLFLSIQMPFHRHWHGNICSKISFINNVWLTYQFPFWYCRFWMSVVISNCAVYYIKTACLCSTLARYLPGLRRLVIQNVCSLPTK